MPESGAAAGRGDNGSCDGATTTTTQYKTLLVNKPRNVLSATTDGSARTTLSDLLRAAGTEALSGHVGRLDFETSGLLLVTTDGRLNRRLRHPDFHCPKAYCVLVAGRVAPAGDARLASMAQPMVGEKGGFALQVSENARARHLRTFQDRVLARKAGYASIDRWMAHPAHAAEVADLHREQAEADRRFWAKHGGGGDDGGGGGGSSDAVGSGRDGSGASESRAGDSGDHIGGNASCGGEVGGGGDAQPARPVPFVDSDGWLTEIEVCVEQGRKHQVRRLVRRARLKLRHLRRTRIGPLELPADLPCGGVRELRGEALASLYSAVGLDACLDAVSGRATQAAAAAAAAGPDSGDGADGGGSTASTRAGSAAAAVAKRARTCAHEASADDDDDDDDDDDRDHDRDDHDDHDAAPDAPPPSSASRSAAAVAALVAAPLSPLAAAVAATAAAAPPPAVRAAGTALRQGGP